MSTKLITLAALLLLSSSAHAKPFPVRENTVVYVDCGFSSGSAVKIGDDEYITAKHVVDEGECTVDGVAITHVEYDGVLDFATFHGPASRDKARVSCHGFIPEEHYLSVGYGLGLHQLMKNPWIASYVKDTYQSFIGEAVPGQSGGAVINRQGVVVGIVNMRWPARSLPLSETRLCD